ncbi:MAG: histidinol-phosphatase, partial [Actinobacteria bacterium]|nr:histidinol-phosphatase [Actinomycetota bacterium]NIS30308.1 histidinol-phosphatase [Actinomycetota bacterium]NIT96420.1 histidinol-phosphatase [Actinomycetota bacterium]NIU65534.1 histidinol-phosphatase [Actinomycetota bacterium]NIV57085.1 histidinol-phosphatase [Actinomycetota bacterium]
TIEDVLDLIEPYPWDFLIGSVHWIGEWSFDHEASIHEFDRRSVEKAYAEYFELEAELAASGAVDILAHVDVIKKLGHRLASPPHELYHRVVRAAERSGVAVEVSSAGLHQKAAEIYPAPEFLEMFARAEVPITLASDAHYATDAARDHGILVAAARAAGYKERLRFRKRAAWAVPLEAG